MTRLARPWIATVDSDDNGGSGAAAGENTARQPAQQSADEPKFTQAELDEKLQTRLRREREKYADFEKFKADSERLRKFEEAEKTEAQKAADAVAAAQKAEADARAEAVRYKAAAAHGIGPDDIDLIGSGSEDEVMARAERLGRLIADSRELAASKTSETGKPTGASQTPAQKAWHPGATPVDVSVGPSAKDRGLAAAQRAGWTKPKPQQ